MLTDSVAALVALGAVTLKRVAQDGMRIRASAGAASFRPSATLERCLEEARERAARERQERIEQALKRLPQMAEIKSKQGKT